MRWRGWWAGAVVLLATGCATEQELAMQQAVDEARERNAAVGAALALLLMLALRHVTFARAAERRAERAAPPRAPGHQPPAGGGRRATPWLVAAAVATELLCGVVLLSGGAVAGWALGPTPYADQTFGASLGFGIVLLFVVPIAAGLVAVALKMQAVAARLPHVGLRSLVSLGVPHALLTAYALSGLFSDASDRWTALLSLALGLVGAGGYWYEAYDRRRAAG